MRIFNYWGRIGTVITLVLVFSGLSLAAAEQPQKPQIPAVIHECEMGDGTHFCSTWRWNGSAFEKTGPDGITEMLTIRFGKVRGSQSAEGRGIPVTFVREVKSGVANGLGAVYKAELRDGKIENGTVTWTYMGIVKSGNWSGTYSYTPEENNQQRSPGGAGL